MRREIGVEIAEDVLRAARAWRFPSVDRAPRAGCRAPSPAQTPPRRRSRSAAPGRGSRRTRRADRAAVLPLADARAWPRENAMKRSRVHREKKRAAGRLARDSMKSQSRAAYQLDFVTPGINPLRRQFAEGDTRELEAADVGALAAGGLAAAAEAHRARIPRQQRKADVVALLLQLSAQRRRISPRSRLCVFHVRSSRFLPYFSKSGARTLEVTTTKASGISPCHQIQKGLRPPFPGEGKQNTEDRR